MIRKHPIRYLPPAEQDLGAIFDYICKDSPPRAASFIQKIDRSISRLERFPLSGAVPKDSFLMKKDYRILVVENYLIFYRFEKKTIFIYRILHGKRRYQFLLKN